MPEQDDEKSLDITNQLVNAYKEANAELLERVSIMKTSYAQQARENELVKQVRQDMSKAVDNKRLLRDLVQEANEGDVMSLDIEKERAKLQDKIKQLSADRALTESAMAKAKKDGLKEEVSLYKDITSEIDEALSSMKKMDEAAGGVQDKTSEIEKKSGASFFEGISELVPDNISGAFGGIKDAFQEGAKEAKKIYKEEQDAAQKIADIKAQTQDKAKAAQAELNKIEEVSFKTKSGKDQTRFRFKKGEDPNPAFKGAQGFVKGDKVKALQKEAKNVKEPTLLERLKDKATDLKDKAKSKVSGKDKATDLKDKAKSKVSGKDSPKLKPKVGGADTSKVASKAAKGAKGVAGGFMKALSGGMSKMIKMLVRGFSKALGPIGLLLEVAMAVGQVDEEVTELQKGLTLSREEALQTRDAFSNMAASSGDVFVTTAKLIKANNTLNQALGTAVVFSAEMLTTSTQLLEKMKMTGEAAAGLAGQTIVTGGSMRDNYESALSTSYEMQRQSGVAVDLRQVMEAVGKTTGQLRAQLGGSTEEIVKAVTQAKVLGMELGDVANAGKQLLDFESSISNELEAELLTGKQLNLEKARMAALTGDQATLAKELAANMGNFTEFSKMNTLQQDALAKSMGMTSDGLADVLMKQEVQGKTARELRAMGKDELAATMEKTTAQDKFNATMDKLKSLIADIVAPLLPILDLLTPVMDLIGEVIKDLMPALNAIKLILTFVVDVIKNVVDGIDIAINKLTFGFAGKDKEMTGFGATEASFGSMMDYGMGGNDLGSGPAGAKPGLAEGGVVTKPTEVIVGEGGEAEAIVPLSKANQMGFGGNNTTVTQPEFNYDRLAQAMGNVNLTATTKFDDFGSRSQLAQTGIKNNQIKNQSSFA